jgi:hypothetical protein
LAAAVDFDCNTCTILPSARATVDFQAERLVDVIYAIEFGRVIGILKAAVLVVAISD